MTKKKSEPNPIEKAIGGRAKDPKAQEKFTKEYQTDPIGSIADEPSPSEMLTLEELNRKTVERLQDQYPEGQVEVTHTVPKVPIIPVSKPDPQPVPKTSSPESPTQTIEETQTFPPQGKVNPLEDIERTLEESSGRLTLSPRSDVKKWTCQECGEIIDDWTSHICEPLKYPEERKPSAEQLASLSEEKYTEKSPTMAESLGQKMNESTLPIGLPLQTPEERQTQKEIFKELGKLMPPAEDIELTNLKKYILEDGFVVATVAFHIVSLCAEPLMTPATTMWDFKDRANIPDMVLALLNQPGYLEGIWPSLKIVMGSNAGNSSWTAGIAMTIAFFDVVRTLPALKELQNDTKKKS